MASGSCLCEAVKFETIGALRDVIYCHCSQCRKQTGHFVAATSSHDADLKVEGVKNIKWYAASDGAKRGFCMMCGSLLFWKQENTDITSIMAGSFDKPSSLKSGFHIHTDDKGDYYEICDSLVTYGQAEKT